MVSWRVMRYWPGGTDTVTPLPLAVARAEALAMAARNAAVSSARQTLLAVGGDGRRWWDAGRGVREATWLEPPRQDAVRTTARQAKGRTCLAVALGPKVLHIQISLVVRDGVCVPCSVQHSEACMSNGGTGWVCHAFNQARRTLEAN